MLRENFTNRIHDLQNSSTGLEDELQRVNAQLELETTENGELKEEAEQLRDEIDQLRNDYDQVCEKMEAYKTELLQAEEEAANLKEELEEVRDELDKLRLSYDQSVVEASGLRIEVKQAQAEIRRLEGQHDDRVTEHAQEMEDLQKDHEKLEERLQ